jgi:hypothetical protein
LQNTNNKHATYRDGLSLNNIFDSISVYWKKVTRSWKSGRLDLSFKAINGLPTVID